MKAVLLNIAIIGSGGFLGAIARYGLGGWVHRQLPLTEFPYGTLAVNLLGCFLIGLVFGLVETRQVFGPELRAFLLIGILGAFTTFSTFGYETFALIREAAFFRALANVGMNVLFGLVLVWLGFVLTTFR